MEEKLTSDIFFLGIKIENADKNTRTTYKINLLDLQTDHFDIPEVKFNSVITLPSNDFQKIPGSPIAYWGSKGIIRCFEEGQKLSKISPVKVGLQTGSIDPEDVAPF